ncbi:arsenate reductase ArsC [Octadecabacter sp. 1_MG-2023]|uniref:arsenate reductase ArsC n=1 Tax=unclassified Octadecabacter TaxID=196158 RepID=UPI001C080148|nr:MULTISPECIES: arsenate reductase ArsC [unclassified Octadecabacter]MBU2993257.1 arsenate reductase ArsC [Octadecabacter sp. B2R22]MDO6733288.1 arsenate reductase ArsC [Octadecabacter sp. 1_MG-2023]
MNILVLCTGNSARSILLESIFNRDSNGRFTAYSAGSTPSGKVHPQSLTLLADKGYATEGLSSQSWDDFAGPDAPQMNIVITVCDSAAAETCPLWPQTGDTPPVQAHWGIPDPAAATEPDWAQAFETAYAALAAKAAALMALPLEDMDRADLKTALNKIADV